ncbi:hypothetical protein L596_000612 [Steinernema carpocapsae]|uniref:Uncharacterized protein n=1 Tax=Steinernema carpocapsae TaxID=34508 RepID=A0A4U8UJG7_STECR|nr:hypothetical protein L596_000612 [Steinernema carpocapsae]
MSLLTATTRAKKVASVARAGSCSGQLGWYDAALTFRRPLLRGCHRCLSKIRLSAAVWYGAGHNRQLHPG